MTATADLPELWLDWCQVTGTPAADLSPKMLERFGRQASPSRAVLEKLRTADAPPDAAAEKPAAPAWPREHHDDTASLQMLLARITSELADPVAHWTTRLRLRRLGFAAVLLAPPSHGGLGLGRERAVSLTPQELASLREQIAASAEPASCPRCAVSSWLEVLGVSNGWSQPSVRALGMAREQPSDAHQHHREGTSSSADWLDCPGLLPAIDRWGFLDLYGSMHISSLSVLIAQMADLMAGALPAALTQLAELPPAARTPARHVSWQEQEEIFARADELSDRVAALLDLYENESPSR